MLEEEGKEKARVPLSPYPPLSLPLSLSRSRCLSPSPSLIPYSLRFLDVKQHAAR